MRHNRIGMEFVRELHVGPESEVNVYRVDGVMVAIKLYKVTYLARNEQNVTSYLRERGIQGVIETYPTGIMRGVASKYYANGELYAYVDAEHGLGAATCRHIFRRLAATLDALHAAGVAHRDLKMENLLVDDDMEVVIGDFGLASQDGLFDRVCGTEAYMAPEIRRLMRCRQKGEGEEGGPCLWASDVWSLGCVLFVMYHGNFPTTAGVNDWFSRCIANEDWAQFWASHGPRAEQMPNEMKLVVQRCLCADPARRATTTALLADPWLGQGTGDAGEAEAYRTEMRRVRALFAPV